MRTLALRIASAVLFGQKRRDALRVARLLESWTRRNFSGPVWILPLNVPGTPYRHLLKHAERVEREILSLVEKRRRDSCENTDVLSLLIRARDDEDHGMTDTELVGQVNFIWREFRDNCEQAHVDAFSARRTSSRYARINRRIRPRSSRCCPNA
jgi:cytochrome P450